MTRVTPRRDQSGAAVVAALGVVAVLLLVAGAGAGVGGLVVAQRRAQSAADLAALAAAQAVQGGEDACAAGDRIADRHEVHLIGCAVEGPEVVITVEVELPAVFAGRSIRARARAGPRPQAI